MRVAFTRHEYDGSAQNKSSNGDHMFLSFPAGVEIDVVDSILEDNYWMFGKYGEEEGWFPASCVDYIVSPSSSTSSIPSCSEEEEKEEEEEEEEPIGWGENIQEVNMKLMNSSLDDDFHDSCLSNNMNFMMNYGTSEAAAAPTKTKDNLNIIEPTTFQEEKEKRSKNKRRRSQNINNNNNQRRVIANDDNDIVKTTKFSQQEQQPMSYVSAPAAAIPYTSLSSLSSSSKRAIKEEKKKKLQQQTFENMQRMMHDSFYDGNTASSFLNYNHVEDDEEEDLKNDDDNKNDLKETDYPLGKGNAYHPGRVLLKKILAVIAPVYKFADRQEERKYNNDVDEGGGGSRCNIVVVPSQGTIITDIIKVLEERTTGSFKKQKKDGSWVKVNSNEYRKHLRKSISNKINRILRESNDKEEGKELKSVIDTTLNNTYQHISVPSIVKAFSLIPSPPNEGSASNSIIGMNALSEGPRMHIQQQQKQQHQQQQLQQKHHQQQQQHFEEKKSNNDDNCNERSRTLLSSYLRTSDAPAYLTVEQSNPIPLERVQYHHHNGQQVSLAPSETMSMSGKSMSVGTIGSHSYNDDTYAANSVSTSVFSGSHQSSNDIRPMSIASALSGGDGGANNNCATSTVPWSVSTFQLSQLSFNSSIESICLKSFAGNISSITFDNYGADETKEQSNSNNNNLTNDILKEFLSSKKQQEFLSLQQQQQQQQEEEDNINNINIMKQLRTELYCH